MYPHERSLVKRMQGKPFELIGVNSDPKERALKARVRESMTWRSFWDGGSTEGPIARGWGVHSWPTLYFIDDRGVIRDKDKRGSAMDEVVDKLVAEALQRFLQQAESDQPEERGLAAVRLGLYQPKGTRQRLQKLLQDPHPDVRRRAAVGWGLLGESLAGRVDLVRQSVLDPVAEVRAAALRVLEQTKDSQLLALAQPRLEDPDLRVRRAAVRALGASGSPKAVPLLVDVSANADPQTAQLAIQGLGRLPSSEAKKALEQLFSRKGKSERVWAAVALHQLDRAGTVRRFGELLQDSAVEVRLAAVRALEKLDGVDLTELASQALADSDSSVQREALQFLASLGTPKADAAVSRFVQKKLQEVRPLLTSKSSRERWRALSRLRALGPAAGRYLVPELPKLPVNTGRMLVSLVATSEDPRAYEQVVEQLRSSDLSDAHRRLFENVLTLAEATGSDVSDWVLELLADKNPTVQESGLRVLTFGDGPLPEKVVRKVRPFLDDPSTLTRVFAAAALARTRDPQAFEVLRDTLRSGKLKAFSVAAYGIVRYEPERALPELLQAAEKARDAHAPPLLSALGKLSDPRATEAIVKLAERNPQLRTYAIYLLYRQGTPAAARALGRFLDDPEPAIRSSAKRYLQRMGLPEAARVLHEAQQRLAKKAAESKKAEGAEGSKKSEKAGSSKPK